MFSEALKTQRRVWTALFMREMQTRWGRRNLGFAWLFAEPLVFAFPVLAIWSVIRAPFEHGVPVTTFVWSGYMPLLIFRHVTGRALYVVRNNVALLYHWRITPFDIFVGCCGLEAVGNMASVAFSFGVLYFLGAILWPHDLPEMFLGYFYMTWWSFDVAMIVAALSERFELVEHIWMVVSYIYMIISGFMFMAVWLPVPLREVALTVDIPLVIYESVRGGLFGDRIMTFPNLPYVTIVLAVLTLVGLWLMRNVRTYVEVT